MVRAWHDRARPLTTITSVLAGLLLLMISLGVGGTATADPGHGNGNGQAASATTAPASPTPTTTTSNGSSHKAGGAASSHESSGTAGTSGDVADPQPKSNADQNGGGANGDCGSYCSTRDGSASGNGNGGGKATGKPCAGCVGKADNKNPPGQYKDGKDHNAGYECDRNHGIGRSNPAHTGCTTSTSTPPECKPKQGEDASCHPVTPGCTPKQGEDASCHPVTPGCTPTSGEDESCHPVTVGCTPKPDEDAGCNPLTSPRRPPTVLGTEASRRPPAVKGTEVANTGALPNTGATQGLGLLGLAGVTLLVVGGLTVGLRRRAVRG